MYRNRGEAFYAYNLKSHQDLSARRGGLRLGSIQGELADQSFALTAAEAIAEGEWVGSKAVSLRIGAAQRETTIALKLAVRMGALQTRGRLQKDAARVIREFARLGTDRELRN